MCNQPAWKSSCLLSPLLIFSVRSLSPIEDRVPLLVLTGLLDIFLSGFFLCFFDNFFFFFDAAKCFMPCFIEVLFEAELEYFPGPLPLKETRYFPP